MEPTEPVRTVEVGDATAATVRFGAGLALPFIAGPAVIEDQPLMANAAERLKKLSEKLEVPVVFKSSYEREGAGPGLDLGLELLAWIRKEFELPVLCDVHRIEDLAAAREVLDVIQIPAILCQQTPLLVAAAETGNVLNVQKSQHLAPSALRDPVDQIEEAGNNRLLLTERGASFGYDDLIADMTAIPTMQALGYPVIFNAGHPVRQDPASEFVSVLMRAAIAAGANGIALETHPHPPAAAADNTRQFPLDRLEDLMTLARDLATLIRTQQHA